MPPPPTPLFTTLRTLLRRPISSKLSFSSSSSSSSSSTPLMQQLARQTPRSFSTSSTSRALPNFHARTAQWFCSSFRNAARENAKMNRTGVKTGRRFASTAPATGQAQGWLKRMWESPIGIKTVHFWAPVMKWCIVLAGISDLARPAEKLSLTQNLALTATGLIWTRWCLIIKPRNILLATVNFFLGMVGIMQVTRILIYQRSLEPDKKATQQVKEFADEVKEEVRDAVGK